MLINLDSIPISTLKPCINSIKKKTIWLLVYGRTPTYRRRWPEGMSVIEYTNRIFFKSKNIVDQIFWVRIINLNYDPAWKCLYKLFEITSEKWTLLYSELISQLYLSLMNSAAALTVRVVDLPISVLYNNINACVAVDLKLYPWLAYSTINEEFRQSCNFVIVPN